jgi:hypothetical protein
MSERTYSCPASPATQSQRTVCDQRSFCQGGSNCFDTSNPADQDFGKAMASMEAAREAGVYGADQRCSRVRASDAGRNSSVWSTAARKAVVGRPGAITT